MKETTHGKSEEDEETGQGRQRREDASEAPGEDQGTGALVMGLGLTAEWGGPEGVYALLTCAALISALGYWLVTRERP